MSLSRRINSIRRPNAGARIAAVAVGFALFGEHGQFQIPANADNSGSLPDAPRSRVANDASPSVPQLMAHPRTRSAPTVSPARVNGACSAMSFGPQTTTVSLS